MTETPTRVKVKGSLYKPPAERPEETNLDLFDYIEDAKVRWQIHLFEWDEFSKEVIFPTAKTAYEWTLKTVDKAKVAYSNLSDNAEESKPPSETL
tara:strand:- start:529 stop:813 length:285 start_codon:yes stop_codon:yes gene_type:complete